MPLLILGALLILTAGSLIVSLYYFDKVFCSNSMAMRFRKAVKEEPPESEYFIRKREAGEAEDIYMQSEDGVLLHAVRVCARAADGTDSGSSDSKRDEEHKSWVILVHGYTGSSRQMGPFAELFERLGLSTLSVDMRAHGQSGGKYRGFGWPDSFDVCDWTDWLIEHYGDDIEVAYFGISMGGATVMNASGHDLPDNVKCIIEDCGYTSTKDILKYHMKRRHGLPSFPVLNETDLLMRIFAGYSIRRDGNAVEQVRRSDTPILFIHGEDDTFVPFKWSESYTKTRHVKKNCSRWKTRVTDSR